MLNKAAKIQRDSPTNIKLVGSGQIPGPVTSGEFYQLSLTTGRARSENPVEGVYTYPAAAVCSSPRRTILVEGGGDSMLCPAADLERNCQVAYEKIEQRSLNILHAVSSEYAIKRKHDHMTRQNSPQEENFSSKRSRTNKLEGETRRGGIDERENGAAADQSDSTFKVSSGDSDLTAERMADGSSRTTSSSDNNNNTNNNNSGYGYGCTVKMDPPCRPSPSTTPGILPSFTEKFQGTCLDSGLHQNIRSNIDNGQTVYRSDGYSSLFKPDSERDEDWLALGLGCGYGSLQPKPLSNQPDLDMTNGIKGSIISWNKDKDKHRDDQRRQQPQQVFTTGHTSSSRPTTLLPPSTSIQAASPQPFSFHNIRADISNYSNSRPLEQGASPNKFIFQRSITDSSTLPGLNLLQPCTMENQERSQTIAVCPSLFPSVEHSFKFQRQTGETSSRLKDAASWQGLYDRISEAGIPGNTSTSNSTDLCFSEPRIGCFYQGSHRLSQGWKSLIPGSAAAYQNLETDGPAYAGMADAAALQQVILEKMQCRTQWNTRDNFSSWCKPEISRGSLIRPGAVEVTTKKFSSAEKTLPFRQQQQYERPATPSDRNMPAPVREMPRFPGASWVENVRIFRPLRTAQAGVWFVLKALNDQNGDRMLPQISRNYLRIKDGTTTILVVKKYLVNKLGLNSESESEIEIMCKGQQLLPSMTLQHVRDVMWSSTFKEDEISRSVASNCSSTDHLMVLHYQRNSRLHQHQHPPTPPPPPPPASASAQF